MPKFFGTFATEKHNAIKSNENTCLPLPHLSITDQALFATNFGSTNIAIILTEAYDMSCLLLTDDERQQSVSARWDWLLHSPTKYTINQTENLLSDNTIKKMPKATQTRTKRFIFGTTKKGHTV